jgi:hypothetical protein
MVDRPKRTLIRYALRMMFVVVTLLALLLPTAEKHYRMW